MFEQLSISSMFRLLIVSMLLVHVATGSLADEDNQCINCHTDRHDRLTHQHAHQSVSCTSCHSGNATSRDKPGAHRGMLISPGNLSDARQTCGKCHQEQTDGVFNSPMHTGKHVVSTTRKLLEPGKEFADHDFQSLGDGISDSMLKKLCASCHLGHEKPPGPIDAVFGRGGGCLACHLHQAKDAHPMLTRRVSDEHCFGCHSRSGRIALSYAGLAETDRLPGPSSGLSHARLADGRLVNKQPADVHHRAGMACIDCHTGVGLMGLRNNHDSHRIDISCNDCHANSNPRLTLDRWPTRFSSMLNQIPFPTQPGHEFLQTGSGTPLTHIDTSDKNFRLYPKLGGTPVNIPRMEHQSVPDFNQHADMTCNSCHTRWIPTCLGCHMQYDPDSKQWDHTSRSVTPGAWLENRWNIDTGMPTLGKRNSHTIDTFLPGMIMTLEHSPSDTHKFIRHFAPIAAHTTGESHTCVDCHQSPVALGLGKGLLEESNGKLVFKPEGKILQDGLAEDAWTGVEHTGSQENYPRPFNSKEIIRIYRANTHGQ